MEIRPQRSHADGRSAVLEEPERVRPGGHLPRSPVARPVETAITPPPANRRARNHRAVQLLEQIGESGFGVVYMAEQQPDAPQVALKVLKAGMDTAGRARFEAAGAAHGPPQYRQVFDGARQPQAAYFVMELVRGIPITEFCDHNCLGVRAARAIRRGVPRGATRTRRASFTATSSRPTCWSRRTTESRCRR